MNNLFSLAEKKAILTGGSRGLGYGMAEGLLEAGCEVLIISASEKALSAAQSFREKGYACHGLRVDIGSAAEREEGFQKAVEILGGLDILVNAAGVQRRHKCEEFPLEDWNLVLEVNLTATFALCQMAARIFLGQGGGKIINVASMLSYFGGFTVPAYAASKGGVAQITKAFSNEWACHNININAIAPGYMDTEMNERLLADPVRNQEITNRIPAKRWGTPEDMKGITVFLASAASDYLNGTVIPVDGGYLSR